MILNLSHIYKDYQQEKLVVPVLKDVSFSVEKGVGDYGTFRIRKNNADEYYRMSGSSDQRVL